MKYIIIHTYDIWLLVKYPADGKVWSNISNSTSVGPCVQKCQRRFTQFT